MDWKAYWNDKASNSDNPFLQVVRISSTRHVDAEASLSIIISHIIDVLKIKNHDTLLDLCCGNGLLTNQLSSKCKYIYGIDFSSALLKTARKHNAPNVQYIEANALDFTTKFKEKAEKIMLYFSFQYFDTYSQGEKVILEMTKALKPGGVILIGDIPDRQHLWEFYNTLPDKLRYYKNKLLEKNEMGKFWSKAELDKICKDNHLVGTPIKQPESLPYSNYRFDYRIEKP